MVKLRAADVVAYGVATHGQILAAQPSGIDGPARSEPGLPPHEPGDHAGPHRLRLPRPGGTRDPGASVRVPHGKIRLLTPGSTVPVAYLPADPGVATVDWSRT